MPRWNAEVHPLLPPPYHGRHLLTASVWTGCTAKRTAVTKARRESSKTQRSHVCMSRQVTAQCRPTLTMWKQKGVMPCSRMFNLSDRQSERCSALSGRNWHCIGVISHTFMNKRYYKSFPTCKREKYSRCHSFSEESHPYGDKKGQPYLKQSLS